MTVDAKFGGQRPRVVVSGLGAVTSQGPTVTEFWEGVRGGRVAIRPVRHLPMDGYRTRLAGEVVEVPTPKHDYPRPDGFADRAYEFALTAAEEAVAATGVDVGAIDGERWGVVVGTCNAGLLSGAHWYRRRNLGETPDPHLVTFVPPQAIAEAIAGVFEFRGPLLSVDTACAAGANAIGYGAELIRSGQADAVVTGGTDALSDVLIAGFNSLESLSPAPAAPYSADRQGLSLGEGSGMLVLLREDLAAALGAPVLAEVAGYGLSADGYHPTAPHPEGLGAARAIQTALRMAGVLPADVDYVNSHGTGTAKNDPAETKATKAGLGEQAARQTAISSTKSMIGHLLGAAGAIEGIVTVKAIEEQVAPPTMNLTTPDPHCDLDYVPNEARPMPIRVALSNNFAFGGANASVVIRRPDAAEQPPPPATDRVEITGIGALTPAGTTLEALATAVAEGADCTAIEDGMALGRSEFKSSDYLSPRDRRRVDRLGLVSVISSHLALADAGLELGDDNRERVGVILGTGVGPMEAMEDFAAPLFAEGPVAANPAVFPNTVYNAAAGQIAIKLGVVGPLSTVTAGHAAGASALIYAFDLARDDHADAVLAVGADVLTDTVAQAYTSLGVVRSEPGGDGFALSEAGVALLCERAGSARARGARPYGVLLGAAVASDGLGVGRWDPEGRGLERAVRQALERSGVAPDDVATVYGSAAGLAAADQPEAAAIGRLFPSAAVVSPQRYLGDTMGAGGALTAAVALAALRRGDHAGPVVVTSSSLGGTHFAVVLGAADEQAAVR